jgi:hypothetical protein
MTKVPGLEYEKVIKALQRDGWVDFYPFPYSETGSSSFRPIHWLDLKI